MDKVIKMNCGMLTGISSGKMNSTLKYTNILNKKTKITCATSNSYQSTGLEKAILNGIFVTLRRESVMCSLFSRISQVLCVP